MRIVKHMPFDDYKADPSLNASTIKNFAVSSLRGADRAGRNSEPSAAMRLGTAFHARIELGDAFDGVAVEVKGLKPGAVPKTWANAEADLEPGQIPLAEGQRIVVEKMHDAAMNHPSAGKLLRMPHDPELSVFWDDPDLGIPCKARIDRWISQTSCVLDLKTTSDLTLSGLEKNVHNFGYHMQAAWYMRAACIMANALPEFLFVFVESSAPFDVVVSPLRTETVEQGWAECCRAAERWRRWRDTGEIEGISRSPLTLSLPRWAEIPGMVAPYALLKGEDDE